MVARNFGLLSFFSLKITKFLEQIFFKYFTTIKLNHQKVPSTKTAVLCKNCTGTDGTFFKQVLVPQYFRKVPCPPLITLSMNKPYFVKFS